MTDTPLATELKRRRDELTRQIAALVEQQRAIDTLLASEAASGRAEAHPAPKRTFNSVSPRAASNRLSWKETRTRFRHALVEQCREAILDAGRPLQGAELFHRIDLEKLDIPSHDRRAYLSALLWKAPHRIVHFREHGYWIADRPFEPLGYSGNPTDANIHIARKVPPVSGLGRISSQKHGEVPPDDVEGPPPEQGGNL